MKKLVLILSFLLLLINTAGLAQESQNDILKNFESGKYTVYKVVDKKKFQKVNKPWPVTITNQGAGVSSVLVKRSGILDEEFKPDVPGYPAYFAFKTYRLTFLKDYAVYYEWNGKQEATTKYVLVKPGGSFSNKWEATNESVASYATATFKNQTNARANVKVAKAAQAEADRKANSLENKKVKEIRLELITTPKKVAHFSEAIDYGIVATLQDGTQLKTSNLGGKLPWDDFKLTHTGCSSTIERVKVDEDATKLTNDEIVLQVQSVYHPSLRSKKAIPTTNDVSIQVSRNGFYGADRAQATNKATFGASQPGGNGHTLTVKVKTVSHKKSGIKLNKIYIYDETERKVVAHYKLTPSTQLIINANGGNGQWGSDGTSGSFPNGDKGGAGGRGGDVTIIKDPSVTEFNITVNNNGGKGGSGGKRYNVNGTSGATGASGAKGTTTTQKKTVQLNF
ncbi:hypothetical protein G5B37_09710 [Rasiella rasia]|uniref:Uncharacterized protein n=1 Tax=Rasiella rasia TaxID=2744027 RepID=A0A6G6GMW2_9FLAO|nr:hypothetical protein [Rasiella rasia]QIE59830.1 hypothetical protein G5B37_09710 [Rasiella rasia]